MRGMFKDKAIMNQQKKYNLDIRGKCYEAGCNFVEEFEVNRCGEDVFYKVYEFNDYYWECECPTLGG